MTGKPAATIEGNVIVPALQACVTGTFAGGAAWSACALFGWADPTAGAVMGFSVTTLCAWLAFRAEASGIEVKQMQAAQPAQSYAQTVTLAISWNDSRAGTWLDLAGVDFERFSTWCAGVSAGRSLGENHWTGQFGIFSKSEYHLMRDILARRGIVRMIGKHHATGYQLTKMGEAVVAEITRRYCNNQPPTQPEGYTRLSAGRA